MSCTAVSIFDAYLPCKVFLYLFYEIHNFSLAIFMAFLYNSLLLTIILNLYLPGFCQDFERKEIIQPGQQIFKNDESSHQLCISLRKYRSDLMFLRQTQSLRETIALPLRNSELRLSISWAQ